MLPLLRDDLEVVLAPSQVTLHRSAMAFTRRGPRRRLLAQAAANCPPAAAGAPAWSGALQAFGQHLHGLSGARANLHIVLASQFVRYAVVPFQANLNSSEDAVYVRQYFAQMFSTSAADWHISVSRQAPGDARLASAVDAALLVALRELCARDIVVLRSVRPQLASTFDRCRRSLPASGWLVLAEAGCLCICLFEAGCWLSVRTLRTANGSMEDLPVLLAREACLANPAGDVRDVYLWAPDQGPGATLPEGPFRFHELAAPGEGA